ncbi:MAG: UDP-N-acetylmuramyl-tripeptide synthetase [Candidatus Falkowbacteria bacterium]
MEPIKQIVKKIIPRQFFKKLQPTYHYLLSFAAATFYGYPSNKLVVIGITGTTGKTSSVYLISKVLETAGYKVGYTSTSMFKDGQNEWMNDKKMTMVGGFFTHKLLRKMVKNRCHYAIVETTSEGIRQFRHRFINYDTLIFTGLYPEHIESHGTYENYKKAKGELFAHLKKCKTKYINDYNTVVTPKNELKKLDLKRVKKTIIANYDDAETGYFLNFWAERKMVYTNNFETSPEGLSAEILNTLEIAEYKNINLSAFGTAFDVALRPDNFASPKDKLKEINIKLKLLGSFSAQNAMNALCAGLAQDLSLSEIKRGLENVKGIAGRMEMINEGQPFSVVVDYAYEPKAVIKLYEAMDLLPHNKIIHILGSCGGGRDKARQPILGDLAGKKADYVVVTNEDPYDDDPMEIINNVFVGAEKAGKTANENLFKILDRREAIAKGLSLAKHGDIVLVTGKGSEQAICLAKGKKMPWDDRQVVKEEILRM